jgi:hypothetical protein
MEDLEEVRKNIREDERRKIEKGGKQRQRWEN